MNFKAFCFSLFLISLNTISAQSIDSTHAYSTGRIKLGMKWNELKPFLKSPPATAPDIQFLELKNGFEKDYLGIEITRVEVCFSSGRVTVIQMNFSNYEELTFVLEQLTNAFGKINTDKGTDQMWSKEWYVGKDYLISLNGGQQLSQYYLSLKLT
jgi:hypothetical protein